MRIAHIITRMIVGGAQENTLLSCIDAMQTYRHEVMLITGPALGPEGDLMEDVKRAGVPCQVIPLLRRNIHPPRDLLAYHLLRRAIDEFSPDVVHTHSAKAGLLGRMAAWSLRVPKVVHTVHGAPFHPYQSFAAREFFRRCEKYAARRCHALVSVADAMTDLLVAAGVAPREKFTTIYSGMNTEPFLQANEHRARARAELYFEPEHVVVGKIARFFHLKGHDDFIAAAALAVQERPNLRFLLVGNGILYDRIQSDIERRGLASHFRFTGLVPPEEIPYYLSAMDALAHTSLREGLARALPQALLAGKPVVSFDIDGAREVVIDNETGFLIPPRDVSRLAEALAALAADAGLRRRLGEEGRRRCAERFDHAAMSQQLQALYERL